jgi:hypothetical protein
MYSPDSDLNCHSLHLSPTTGGSTGKEGLPVSAIDCTATAVETRDFKVNTTKGVVVANDNYWRKINHETPRGSKVQLLGIGA